MNKLFKQLGISAQLIPYVLFIVIALVLWFAWKFVSGFLERLGLKQTPDEAAYQNQVKEGRTESVKNAATAVKTQYETQKSSKNDFEWQTIAEQIHKDLRIKLDNDHEDAGYQVCRVQNDTDVYKLIQAFGTRPRYLFGIPYTWLDLPGFVHEALSDKVGAINDNYKRKGIKFRF